MKYCNVILLWTTVFISACGSPPKCSDEKTINIVKSVAMDRVGDSVTHLYGSFSYETVKDQIEKGERYLQQVLEQADLEISKTTITVDGIRSIDSENSHQSHCAANIKINRPGGVSDGAIEFTAQFSDDGKVLNVEVRGL